MKILHAALVVAISVRPCFAEWKVCEFQGIVLPLLKDKEREWPMGIRLILYLLGLFWLFLAVGMISDIFMGGIERVTSWRRRVKKPIPGKDPPEFRTVTVYIWNNTISNLTLMALGSSAPEILLSVIEILFGDYLLGDLGAGTIVGSAAFNLLVISAVCVVAIPDNKYRKIKEVPVYIVTSVFSVFAYIWLMFIVMISSPEVVTAAEAIITLLFLPLLLVLAYLADRGKITFGIQSEEKEKKTEITVDNGVTKEEMATITKEIRDKHGSHLTDEQVTNIMKIEYLERRNRAYYRRHVKASVRKKDNMDSVFRVRSTDDDIKAEKDSRAIYVGLECPFYAVLESCQKAEIKLIREGNKDAKVSVWYETRAGTATAGTDFKHVEGTMIFEHGEMEKTIEIEIMNDNAYEDGEDFYVDLKNPKILDDSNCSVAEAKLAEQYARITIIDDDLPGKLRFQKEEMVAMEDEKSDAVYNVIVERYDGSTGIVGCKYETQKMSAIPGVDYVDASGTLTFEDSVMTRSIPITIKHSGRYAREASFTVTLTDPKGGVLFNKDSDGGEHSCVGHVTIKGNQSEGRDSLLAKMKSSVIASTDANRTYIKQFYDAIFKVKDDDDDDKDDEDGESDGEDLTEKDDSPSLKDWIFHIIGVPWKLLFAFVPPPQFLGGWATFFGALAMIAVITALIGDMANLVGCCLGLDPEITAITFVALGTSLPDTFASKAAAEMDPYADNSIGNVTGSNSVNVFIGLGLSWSIAALYWETTGPNEAWLSKYSSYEDNVRKSIDDARGDSANAVFMVPSGSLWFNLMVFSLNAFCAIQHLYARRRKHGGELGGPKHGFMGQYFSAAFLLGQWFIYVIASTIYVYTSK